MKKIWVVLLLPLLWACGKSTNQEIHEHTEQINELRERRALEREYAATFRQEIVECLTRISLDSGEVCEFTSVPEGLLEE